MKQIKNILFDLGGVILNLDIGRTEAAFAALLGDWDEHRTVSQQLYGMQLFERFEVGAVTEAHFVETLQAHNPNPTTAGQVRLAWSAMLLDLPAERLALLRRLREQGYRLYLLSNTNSIHLADFYTIVQRQHGIDFDALFDKTYYSHLIALRKPGVDVYYHVLEDAGIEATETLFIDDNAANIEGAKSAGLQTVLHRANSDLEQSLMLYLK